MTNTKNVFLFQSGLCLLILASILLTSAKAAVIPNSEVQRISRYVTEKQITKSRYCISLPSAIITSCMQDCSVVVIPESIDGYRVTEIAKNAFKCCTKLTTITIPSEVTLIDDSAFAQCCSLTEVIIKATHPPTLGSEAFPQNTLTIKVPQSDDHSVLKAYRNASGWRDFADHIREQD